MRDTVDQVYGGGCHRDASWPWTQHWCACPCARAYAGRTCTTRRGVGGILSRSPGRGCRQV